MKCPQCKQTEKFTIYRWHLIRHEGCMIKDSKGEVFETGDSEPIKFGPIMFVRCSCGHEGSAEDFEMEESEAQTGFSVVC